jgi:hypothetical protein
VRARATSGTANRASSIRADSRARWPDEIPARTRRIQRLIAAFLSVRPARRVKGFGSFADTVRWMGRQTGEVTMVPATHR